MSQLPIERAHRLAARTETQQWLIEGLWAHGAVGIIGAEPKCCKSFLGLDMAISVASGTHCLRKFPVTKIGSVLLFAAEDALHVVRDRLEGIARAADVLLEDLDIHVITAPTLRLDQAADRASLEETVATLRPTLLVLDPFVRLHRIDENTSAEVAPLLAYLRDLQRKYDVAVVLIHHAKKGAGKAREGQALRGSSEFHAWGDSNLYLRRKADRLILSIEHRAAPSVGGISLELVGAPHSLALNIIDAPNTDTLLAPPTSSPTDRVLEVLAAASAPLGLTALRRLCRVRTQSLAAALQTLLDAGRITKTSDGYQLAS